MKRIVAEITRNWGGSEDLDKLLISQTFEQVIEINRIKGYDLENWQMTSTYTPADDKKEAGLVQTIVAVFVKKE